MELIVDFGGLGAFRNEVLDFLYLGFVSSLEAWRIVEDKFGVAGKDEWIINVVGAALMKIWKWSSIRRADRVTSAIGLICYEEND